jgi:hypothetical protein
MVWLNEIDYWKLLSILVAVFVAWISYMQFRTAREKPRLDLFEKRYEVFDATRKLYARVN